MRAALRGGAATLAITAGFAAFPALAQTAATETADAETIVVTGTLIRDPNLVAAAPITAVAEEEISLRNISVAEDLLRELPGIVPSIGSAVNNGNGGASYVNLRGLGENRNLVLLDGKRIAPSDLVGRVDLNNIPVALVQRVDVLTGGASTTYGADAITGVVNFITKQDFAGVDLQTSLGITEEGDGQRFRVDLTIGANFDDGRGNVVMGIGYQDTDPVFQGSRDVSISFYDSIAGVASGSGTSTPSRFSNVYTAAPGTDFVVGAPGAGNIQGTRQVTADGTAFRPTAAFDAFNFNPDNIFQTPFERFNVYTAGRYEVFDDVEVFGRALFSRNTVRTIIAPSGAFNLPVQVNLNNPFLTADQRNAFCRFDTNTGVGYTPRFDQATCDAAANPNLRPGDAAYREVTTGMFRRTTEVGPRISNFQTTVFDFNAGLRGDITDNIGWEVSGSYGESENVQAQSGYTLNSRVRQSLLAGVDANGNPTCFNPANGCVPANFFGANGSITPEAGEFIAGASSLVSNTTTLTQARALINGGTGFAAPWAANEASFAVGAEFRDYGAQQVSDLLSQSGDLGGAGGAAPNISGGYNVWELLAETQIPLIEDRGFIREATIGGGVRWSNYTVNAPGSPNYDALTWNVNGGVSPADGLRLRGTYAKAVRAPNINELFSPLNTVLTNLSDDPCANIRDDGTPVPGRPIPSGTLRDVCIAQGAPAGSIGSIPQPVVGQANTTTGGNPFLGPEEAKTWTVGLAFAPQTFLGMNLAGISFSVDYYNIVVTGAVTTPTPQDAIDACFAGANLSVSNPACVGPTGFGRNPIDGGLSGDPATTRGLFLGLTNLGRLEARGLDFTFNYARDFGDVGFRLNFLGNWSQDRKFKANENDPLSFNRDCVGFYSSNCGSLQPAITTNTRATFTWKGADFSILWRHLSSTEEEPGSGFFQGALVGGNLNGQVVDFTQVPAYNYLDLNLGFNVTENLSVAVLIQNLTDKDPPNLGNSSGTTAYNSGNTFPSTYDALGRRYAVTARVRF
jgi:outer membrane receptor protein involved in Fe transport